MARSKGEKPRRRGSGFRPPELRGTLGTLWRTTLQQAGVVRDALERGAREGRSRLDEARTSRKRHDALAELGEIVLELIRNGEIDVAELPEAQDLVAYLDELDGTDEDQDNADIARATSRSRFDHRTTTADDDRDGTVSSSRWSPPKPTSPARVWRPTADDDTPDPAPPPPPTTKRKGGIQFGNDDDDSDLKDYMHPDDVPPKPPKDSDGSSGP